MLLIGIGFNKQVGKDTTADYLVKKYNFKKESFADPLKEACKIIFGFTDEQVHGSLKEVEDDYWKVTPRFALQKVGTECFRNNYDKNIWVKSLEKKIVSNKHSRIVVQDIRFMNELYMIKKHNGYLINVKRDNLEVKGGIIGHASEEELKDFHGWDFTIYNNGTYEELYKKIDNLILHLTKDS